MNTDNPTVELMLLKLRAAHKHQEMDEALRIGWGWRVPRLETWALEMLVSDAEDQLAEEQLAA